MLLTGRGSRPFDSINMQSYTAFSDCTMKHLTIRNIPPDLARALDVERKRRGWSLTRTVKELLRKSLGLGPGEVYDNGLRGLAGGWTDQDLRDFEEATAVFERIDEELWK